MNIKLTAPIFQIGKPNLNGKVYSLATISSAINKLSKKMLFGESIMIEFDPDVELDKVHLQNYDNVCAKMIDLSLTDSEVLATIELLDVKNGRLLYDLLSEGAKFIFSPRMTISLDPDDKERVKSIFIDVRPVFDNANDERIAKKSETN